MTTQAAVAVSLRSATQDDVPALEQLMLVNDDPQAGVEPAPAGAQRPYLAHLVRRGTVAVAVRGTDGEVVGFGATVDGGRARHLADLFVLPALQGQGLGGRLLAAVFGDVWPRTTFASSDPRALPLYVRQGMRPLWPNLYLTGDPRALPPPPGGYSVEPVSLEAMADLEREWNGVDRAPDLPYWSTVADCRPYVVRANGRAVATGLSRRRLRGPGRWMDHVVVAPTADPAAALLVALRDDLAGDLAGDSLGGACVPGPSPIVRPLLEAGFRIVDHDTFLASDPTLVDPEREIVNTGLL